MAENSVEAYLLFEDASTEEDLEQAFFSVTSTFVTADADEPV